MLGRSSSLLGLSPLAAVSRLPAHMPGEKTRARHAASGSRPVPRKVQWFGRKERSYTWHDPARVAAAQAKRERKAAKRAADRVHALRCNCMNDRPMGDRNAYEVH